MNWKWAAGGLVLLSLVTFANSFSNAFVWDDEEQIVANAAVHSLANIQYFFSGSTFNSGGAGQLGGLYYKPLMSVSYATIYSIFGPRPFFFHFIQTLLHGINAVLVMRFLYYLFYEADFQKNAKKVLTSQQAFWLAGFLAALFVVHPINVESVVYIASMQEVLFMVFGLGAVLVALRQEMDWRRVVMVGGLLLASLLSKETGIIWLLSGGLMLWLFQIKKLERYLVAAGGAVAVYAFLRFAVAEVFLEKHGLSPITLMSFSERLLSLPKIVWFYFLTYFFPQRLLIAQHWVVTELTVADFWWPVLFVIGLVFFGLVISWYVWRSHSVFWKQWVIFPVLLGMGLGLHLQIFPLDMTVADRWFYLPQIGVLGLLSVLGIVGWQTAKKRVWLGMKPGFFSKTMVVIGIILVALLMVRSWVRNTTWKNGLELYSHDAQYVQSFDLENNLGVEYFRAGQIELAKQHFVNSTQLAAHWWTNWNNLGVVEERAGQLDQALNYYQKSIDNGQYYLAYQNKARILLQQDPAAATSFIESSLSLFPQNLSLWQYYVAALVAQQEWEKARAVAERLYRGAPSVETADLYRYVQENTPLATSSAAVKPTTRF